MATQIGVRIREAVSGDSVLLVVGSMTMELTTDEAVELADMLARAARMIEERTKDLDTTHYKYCPLCGS